MTQMRLEPAGIQEHTVLFYRWNYSISITYGIIQLCIYVVRETVLANERPSAGVQAEHYAGSYAIAVAF